MSSGWKFDVKLKAVGTEDPRRVSRSDEKGQNQRPPSSEALVDRHESVACHSVRHVKMDTFNNRWCAGRSLEIVPSTRSALIARKRCPSVGTNRVMKGRTSPAGEVTSRPHFCGWRDVFVTTPTISGTRALAFVRARAAEQI